MLGAPVERSAGIAINHTAKVRDTRVAQTTLLHFVCERPSPGPFCPASAVSATPGICGSRLGCRKRTGHPCANPNAFCARIEGGRASYAGAAPSSGRDVWMVFAGRNRGERRLLFCHFSSDRLCCEAPTKFCFLGRKVQRKNLLVPNFLATMLGFPAISIANAPKNASLCNRKSRGPAVGLGASLRRCAPREGKC